MSLAEMPPDWAIDPRCEDFRAYAWRRMLDAAGTHADPNPTSPKARDSASVPRAAAHPFRNFHI